MNRFSPEVYVRFVFDNKAQLAYLATSSFRGSRAKAGWYRGLVGTGGEFPESLNLKAGQGVSYFLVHSRNMTSPNQEIKLHGNKS